MEHSVGFRNYRYHHGYVRANPNEDPAVVANDHVRTIAGSGEITLTNDVVRENTKPTLTFTL